MHHRGGDQLFVRILYTTVPLHCSPYQRFGRCGAPLAADAPRVGCADEDADAATSDAVEPAASSTAVEQSRRSTRWHETIVPKLQIRILDLLQINLLQIDLLQIDLQIDLL